MPDRFVTVTITKKGREPVQWIKEVTDKIHFELQNEIKLSADATADIMKRILMSSGYKLTTLAGAINAEVLNDVGGIIVGIGRISDLPKDEQGRDYWNAFNDGWLPPANLGYWDGDKWIHTGNKSDTLMVPRNPIRPLQFVEIGYGDLKSHIDKQISKFLKDL
jgi:hypothetical protein